MSTTLTQHDVCFFYLFCFVLVFLCHSAQKCQQCIDFNFRKKKSFFYDCFFSFHICTKKYVFIYLSSSFLSTYLFDDTKRIEHWWGCCRSSCPMRYRIIQNKKSTFQMTFSFYAETNESVFDHFAVECAYWLHVEKLALALNHQQRAHTTEREKNQLTGTTILTAFHLNTWWRN